MVEPGGRERVNQGRFQKAIETRNEWCLRNAKRSRETAIVKIAEGEKFSIFRYGLSAWWVFWRMVAGFPARITSAGYSPRMTTEPAAMIVRGPIVTPFKIIAFAPTKTSSPIWIGLDRTKGSCSLNGSRRFSKSKAWKSWSKTRKFPPRLTFFPI